MFSSLLIEVPPCSDASRDASLFALDPPCARRLDGRRRDAGRPLKYSTACGASNTGLALLRSGLSADHILSGLVNSSNVRSSKIPSPVFDAPQAVELHDGTPRVPTLSVSRRAEGGSRAKSEASLDASEHGGKSNSGGHFLPVASNPDALPMTFIIAVDGPAASGKGTIASRLAVAFALPYLDTGLLYRAAGVQAGDAPSPGRRHRRRPSPRPL